MRGAVCYNLLIRQKAGEAMALGKEYFESLGLEIAKRKYYNAAKVESVIEDFSRRAAVLEGEKAALEKGRAALESENAALRTRAEALSCGREEIGDAILSAKVISQQLLADRYHRDRGISLYPGILPCSEQQNGTQYSKWQYQYHLIGQVEHCSYRHNAKRHMR